MDMKIGLYKTESNKKINKWLMRHLNKITKHQTQHQFQYLKEYPKIHSSAISQETKANLLFNFLMGEVHKTMTIKIRR